MTNFLLWAFYFVTLYAFIPALASRLFGFRVFKKGRAKKEIALTFDDGPDSIYTPKLLDLLARYDAKATFFVVGSHAEDKPELLQRMHNEGHVIGIHNYIHKSNWFMLPRTVNLHIERTNQIIENAVGKRATFYRPPWGIMNLFDFRNSSRMQIVLWSAIFGDWHVRLGADRLKARMMKKLRPGQVLLLHDCGRTPGADENAPANMLEALEHYMEEGVRRGFRFVGVDELMKLSDKKERAGRPPVWKRTLIAGWLAYEKVFQLVFRLKDGGPVFHYRTIKYGGRQLKLADGRVLSKGDPVVEIHFDNRKLSSIAMQAKSPIATIVKLIRETEAGLAELANFVIGDLAAREAKAVYGVTMIHRGADRVGFELFDLPDGFFAKASKVYLRVLMRVLTNNKGDSKGHEQLSPRVLIMPMNRLLSISTAENQELTAQETARRLAAGKLDGGSGSVLDDTEHIHGNTPAL